MPYASYFINPTTSTAGDTTAGKPGANQEIEILGTVIGVNLATTSIGRAVLERADVTDTITSTTPEKFSSRSPAFGGTIGGTVSLTNGGPWHTLLILHAGLGKSVFQRWRPPRPWATPKIQAAESFDIFPPAGWYGDATLVSGATVELPTGRPIGLRVARRPRRPYLWHWRSEREEGVAGSSLNTVHGEGWVAWVTPNPNFIRQNNQYAGNAVGSGGGGPNLTLISVDALLTVDPAIQREMFSAIPASMALTEAIQRLEFVSIPVSATVTPAISKVGSRSFAATLTLSAAFQKRISRAMSSALSMTPTLSKTALHYIAIPASVVMTPVVSRVRTAYVVISANLTLTPSLGERVTILKTLAASLTTNPILNRKLFKTISAGLTVTPALNLIAGIRTRTLSASFVVTPTMTTLKTASRALSASLSLLAAESRPKVTRRIDGLLGLLSGSSKKTFVKVDSAPVLTPGMSIAPPPTKISLNSVLSFVSTVNRKTRQGIDSVVALVGIVIGAKPSPRKPTGHSLTGAVLDRPTLTDTANSQGEITEISDKPSRPGLYSAGMENEDG